MDVIGAKRKLKQTRKDKATHMLIDRLASLLV